MRVCRYCHAPIESMFDSWVTDDGTDIYDFYCPNNVLARHWPYSREDAITAVSWIYKELS